jgi:hypothetical protein
MTLFPIVARVGLCDLIGVFDNISDCSCFQTSRDDAANTKVQNIDLSANISHADRHRETHHDTITKGGGSRKLFDEVIKFGFDRKAVFLALSVIISRR